MNQMVKGILPDVNIPGQFQFLLHLLNEETRRELWTSLNWITPTFEQLGLLPNSSDLLIWQKCQQEQLVLLTANRNEKGAESLQFAIRSFNKPDSIPVFTLANQARITKDRPYAEHVADRLLEYAFDIDNLRGTGRIYLP